MQISRTLFVISLFSLLLLLLIRIYAAAFSVPVRTWDDRFYRNIAVSEAQHIDLLSSVQNVLLPTSRTLGGERAIGYHLWLVLGLKILSHEDPEHALQWVNIFFLLMQAAFMFLIMNWAFRDRAIAVSVTFVFISTSIVYGINRWIYTENHVLAALLCFACLPLVLLSTNTFPKFKSKQMTYSVREIAIPVFTGLMFGVFSSLREYALPSFFAASVCLMLALRKQKRNVAFVCFILVLGPYLFSLIETVIPIYKALKTKAAVDLFYVPMADWIRHVFQNNVGPATSLFLVLATFLMILTLRHWRIERGRGRSGTEKSIFKLFLFSYLVLISIYFVGVLVSVNRNSRSIVPILVCAFVIVALFFHRFPINSKFLYKVYSGLIVIIAVSWAFMYYQLFVAYDGGRAFALHPFKIKYEVYNHPLNLPELVDENDMHIRPKWTANVPWWKISKDLPDE